MSLLLVPLLIALMLAWTLFLNLKIPSGLWVKIFETGGLWTAIPHPCTNQSGLGTGARASPRQVSS